jgi:two-component system sensor histidine kinase KdpD
MDLEKLPSATVRDLAKSIQKEASRLSHIVTNLLDISTLEAGRVRLNRQPYFIQEIIGSALSHAEHALTGHPVSTQAADDLPMAMVDGVLIEQVLQNLIENAAHHTPPNTTITVSAELSKDVILVSVADTGVGIPKGEEEKIFDKFYAIAQRSSYKGTGLGLAICASIVKAHDQRIWAKNRPEGGAIFTFSVPVADASKLEMPHDDA